MGKGYSQYPPIEDMRALARRLVRHDPEPPKARQALSLLLNEDAPVEGRTAVRVLRREVMRFIQSDSPKINKGLRADLYEWAVTWGARRSDATAPAKVRQVYHLTEGEYAELVEAARRLRVPRATFARQAVLEAARRVIREGGETGERG